MADNQKDNQTEKPSFWARFKKKSKSLLVLFWTMFKIGLFTFGGGYAMIHMLENEFVAKKKWLDNDEFFDLVTIAESTPGPVAINCSTYIGYKTEGFIGSCFATLAMCLPSFIIIFVISLFFNAFLANKYIAAAFKGIQVCAVFLILCAGIKMAKKLKITVFNVIIFIATFAAMILVSIFGAKFSSIFYILISGGLGLFIYSITYFKAKLKKDKIASQNLSNAVDTKETQSTDNCDNIASYSTNENCQTNDDIQTNDKNLTNETIPTDNIDKNIMSESSSDDDLGGEK